MRPKFTLWIGGLLLWSALGPAQATALDDYVAKPDPAYSYNRYHTENNIAYKTYFIEMVSQQWRTLAEVDRPVWTHELSITVPTVRHSSSNRTALMLINGGSNGGTLDTETNEFAAALAAISGSVVAVVNQIPNQPLYFTDEVDVRRKEDAILAYSLDKYLDTGDPEWPVHVAMVKAAVRAMDTIQNYLEDEESITIEDFIVLGGSKRGWTTWLTAAVDSRVKAILPISIDMPNLEEQFTHHWEAYGFYAPALDDYAGFDLPCRMQSQLGAELLDIIDPYNYRNRYTLPKLIVNSAGDQFFTSDSSQFYFHDMPGPKLMRYTFNTDHGQGEDQDAIIDLVVGALLWMDDVNSDNTGPQFEWSFEADGSIKVQTSGNEPDKVYLWQATNPDARDFRLESLGPAWFRTRVYDSGNGIYVGNVTPPAKGFTAYALELVYPTELLFGLYEVNQVYTTDVRITPDILPFAMTACQPRDNGRLVVGDREAGSAWAGVDLGSAAFGVPPVVLAGPPTQHDPAPGVTRLRNVSDQGFDLRFQEWDYQDGTHGSEHIPYLALEPGRHLMTDGSVWEVGRFSLSGTGFWKKVSFDLPFASTPRLFLTAQTFNGPQAISVRARGVNREGFDAALFEQQTLMDGHLAETIGYVAVWSPAGSGALDLAGESAPYLLQSLKANHRWAPALVHHLKVEEEQSGDAEVLHVDELVDALALGNKLFAQQVTNNGPDPGALRRVSPEFSAKLEWGVIDGITDTWTSVPLYQDYTDPVVVAKPVSGRGSHPGIVRLDEVGLGGGFRLRYQEWDYLDGVHAAAEQVFYLVAERGVQSIGGLSVEAQQVDTGALARSGAWESEGFSAGFTQLPGVFAAVQTTFGGDAVTTRVRALSTLGFQVAMDEQESNSDGHTLETIGWIAIAQGQGTTTDGRLLEVRRTPVSSAATAIGFPARDARYATVIADVTSSAGMDPVFIRHRNPSATAIELYLQEEQSKDAEMDHVTETASVLIAE